MQVLLEHVANKDPATLRQRMPGLISMARDLVAIGVNIALAEAYESYGRWPASEAELGAPLVAEDGITWECYGDGDIAERHLPLQCREENQR